jgi:hypothetical protein
MADYELYGEYNRGEDDEEYGPPPHPFVKWFKKIVYILGVCVLVFAVSMLAFRLILAGYYPKSIKQLYYTDALTAYYQAGGDMSAKTQDLRVHFEAEVIETDKEHLQVQTQQNGFYYGDNLIVVEGAGALQCSIRLNRHAFFEIGEKYGLADFAFTPDAFTFVLEDNLGNTYTPSAVLTDAKMLYRYYKLCYDGISFEGVTWMRVVVIPNGVDTTKEDYVPIAVCVYENHENYNRFTDYKLGRQEVPQSE